MKNAREIHVGDFMHEKNWAVCLHCGQAVYHDYIRDTVESLESLCTCPKCGLSLIPYDQIEQFGGKDVRRWRRRLVVLAVLQWFNMPLFKPVTIWLMSI